MGIFRGNAMKLCLIGHRGVGKTSLGRRMHTYFDGTTPFIDLDEEIEKFVGKSITAIFQEKGEDFFRELEVQMLQAVVQRFQNYIIALGAGLKLDRIEWPREVQRLWVQRDSDSKGRIFVDRPRLDENQQSLLEYHARFEDRNKKYERNCTSFYLMPEGIFEAEVNEKNYLEALLNNENSNLFFDASVTIPKNFEQNKSIVLNRFRFGLYEIRTDYFDEPELIFSKIQHIPKSNVLYSIRKKEQEYPDLSLMGSMVDWPLEFGMPDSKLLHVNKDKVIYSSHSNSSLGENPLDFFKIDSKDCEGHFKYSPFLDSIEEAFSGIRWQRQDPEKRSFLPRSKDGRFKWVRLFLKGKQKINFVRFFRNEFFDQPSILEWLRVPTDFKNFAAILGDPVDHSFTPSFQSKFFKEFNMPVFAINVGEKNFSSVIEQLSRLGALAFAVTSPLKKAAFEFCRDQATDGNDELANRFESVNTLVFDGNIWRGTNTDRIGFGHLFSQIYDRESVAVWGGGGTLKIIKDELPNARFFSSRTGLEREAEKSDLVQSDVGDPEKFDPLIVIWAAGVQAAPPEQNWRPLRVVDLNYAENSAAREYSLSKRCQYISGLEMFTKQGEAQRFFWKKYLL